MISYWPMLLATALAWATPAIARDRAFVVGIDRYEHFEPQQQLRMAVADAKAIAKTLKGLGFEVTEVTATAETKLSGFWDKFERFALSIGKDDTVVLFFAGHGIQRNGKNYLLPGDAARPGQSEGLVINTALDFSALMTRIAQADPKRRIAILDACRTDPYVPARAGGTAGGLAPVATVNETFVLYSAAEGQTALDRLPGETNPQNSPFTRTLIEAMTEKHLPLEAVTRQVRIKLRAMLGALHPQSPTWYDGLNEAYCINGGCERVGVVATAPVTAPAPVAPKQAAVVVPQPQALPTPAATAPAALAPGTVFRDCPTCPEMVVVPAGKFVMGSPATEKERQDIEGPQRTVTIAKPFAVGKFAVMFAEWDACVAANGCTHKPDDAGWGRGKRPVINVSWDDAKQYVAWLSKTSAKTYRLLTEAEWEYAARAGTTTPFSTGATISTDQANYDGNATYGPGKFGVSRQKTVEVGSFPANPFGLHDMHGNVWQWVEDCYADSHTGAPTDGAAAKKIARCPRVLRGGSWFDKPHSLRSALRSFNSSDGTDYFFPGSTGFRVAKTF